MLHGSKKREQTFLWWGQWKFQQAKNWRWSKWLDWFVIDLNQSNDSLRAWITLTWLTQWCYVTKWTSVMVLLLYFKDCETYINVVTDWLFIWLCEVKIKTYQTHLCTSWPSQDGQHAPFSYLTSYPQDTFSSLFNIYVDLYLTNYCVCLRWPHHRVQPMAVRYFDERCYRWKRGLLIF